MNQQTQKLTRLLFFSKVTHNTIIPQPTSIHRAFSWGTLNPPLGDAGPCYPTRCRGHGRSAAAAVAADERAKRDNKKVANHLAVGSVVPASSWFTTHQIITPNVIKSSRHRQHFLLGVINIRNPHPGGLLLDPPTLPGRGRSGQTTK